MAIKFEKVVQQSKLLSPLNNFELDTQTVEYRIDPLTKETTFLNVTAAERGVRFPIWLDEALLKEAIEKSRQGCFLCTEQVDKSAARYVSEIVPEGILRVGQVCLFPNIFALAKHTAVLTIPGLHYLSIAEYTPSLLNDCFTGALEFIKRVHNIDPSAEYAVIGCNYLFPAGSSSVHSHFHIFVDSIPFGYVKRLLDESRLYLDKNGANYWPELIEAEKVEKERYIGSIGNTEWLVPFAPTGDYEVHAVVREKSSFISFAQEDVAALAEGLAKVLQYYSSQNLFSFNMMLYSGPLGDKSEYFWSGLKVASRAYLPPYYTSDVTWRQRLMQRYELWIDSPEKVAVALRAAFRIT